MGTDTLVSSTPWSPKCKLRKLTQVGIDTRLVHGNIDSVQEFSRASTLVDDEEAGPSIELQNLKPPPRAFVGASGMPRAGLPRTHAAEYHTYHWSVSVSSYEGEEYEDGLIEN